MLLEYPADLREDGWVRTYGSGGVIFRAAYLSDEGKVLVRRDYDAAGNLVSSEAFSGR